MNKKKHRLKSSKDLPGWFDIGNYLTKCMQRNQLQQFRYRHWLSSGVELLSKSDEVLPPYDMAHYENNVLSDEIGWAKICDGKPLLSEGDVTYYEPTRYQKLRNPKKSITNVEAISGITANSALSVPWNLESMGAIEIEEKQNGCFGVDYSVSCETDADLNYICYKEHNLSGILGLDEAIWLSVDLSNYTDKELVHIFKEFLPIWRSELDIPEPQNILGKDSEQKKLFEYRVIPLIDLLIWSNLNAISIPNRIMAVALFPDGEKGEIEFLQTILPFVKKVLDIKYRWLSELDESKNK